MNIGVVSKRYAKALLDFAIAKGNEEKIYKEVKTLAGHFANVPDLKRTVENPVLTRKMKLDLLVEAAGGKDVSEEMKRFLQLVIDGKREKFLHFMTWSFIDQYRERKHILIGKLTILIGKLTTAVEAPELVRHLEEIGAQKTDSKVVIEANIDPSIIGGYIMEIDGYRLDASVANQLSRIKRQFIDKNRRIVKRQFIDKNRRIV